TEGVSLNLNTPRTYIPVLNQYVRSGLSSVEATIAFYGSSDTVWKISKGMDPSSLANYGPNNTIYSLLCIFPSKTIDRCFYFPKLTTTSPAAMGAYKNRPTSMQITFGFQDDPADNPDGN